MGSVAAGLMSHNWVDSMGIHDTFCLGTMFVGVTVIMVLLTTPTVIIGSLGLLNELTEEEATA